MAKHRVLIEVKQCDIDKGKMGNELSCPIALAIKRKRPSLRAEVFWESVEIGTADEYGFRKNVSLPKKARRFAERFDNGKQVKPFGFVLRY